MLDEAGDEENGNFNVSMMLNYDCDVFPGGDCSQLFPGGPQHRGQVQAVRPKVDEGDDDDDGGSDDDDDDDGGDDDVPFC